MIQYAHASGAGPRQPQLMTGTLLQDAMEDKAAAEQAHEVDLARLAELTQQRDQLQRLLQV